MNKRERLERTIAGEMTDRTPVALWRHFPGDDIRSADLAQAILHDQRTFEWDIVNIMPASSYQVTDYGLRDDWIGSVDGVRASAQYPVTRSLGWTELRSLDAQRGSLQRATDCTRLVTEALSDTPVLLTIYSPLLQAEMLAGRPVLMRHLRTQPDRLKSGLSTLTENIVRYLDALRKLALAGICYVIAHADYEIMAEDEYRNFGFAYDRRILDSLPQKWWLNLVRLTASAPMFRLICSLPTQGIQWRDQEVEPDITLGKSLSIGAVCGGLASERDLYRGTPTSIRDVARDSMQRVNQRRLILSSGSPLWLASPYSNLRAAREVVEPAGI